MMGQGKLVFAIAALLGSASAGAAAPASRSVWTVDAIDVKSGMMPAARRYYAAKWIPARRLALKRGLIRSFRLLELPRTDPKAPEILLITEYGDARSFERREAWFAAIFKELKLPAQVTVDGLGRDAIVEASSGAEDYTSVVTGGPR